MVPRTFFSAAFCAFVVCLGWGVAAVRADEPGAIEQSPTSEASQLPELFQFTQASVDSVLSPVLPNEPLVRAQSGDGDSYSGPECTNGHWWVVAPYVWIPGIKGQITTFGVQQNISIDTSDVLSHLHDANGALQLHLESGVGQYGLIVDTNIIRMSQTRSFTGGALDFDLQQTLLEVLGMYRMLEVPSEGMQKQSASVDLLGGARYYNFTNGLNVTFTDPTIPTVPLGQSASWVDLVVGVRGRAPITQGLDGFLRADIGGFGIGTSSTFAWNLIAGLDWHPTDHLSFLAGYRVLDIDESQGSGTAEFAFNAKMQGPFIAFALRY